MAEMLAMGALLSFGLCACAAPQKRTTSGYAEDARLAYEKAIRAFDAGDCLTAEPLFSSVRKEFPYSRFAALSELKEAECMNRDNRWAEAVVTYRRFIRTHPRHPELHSAYFQLAETHYRQIPDSFLGITPPPEERDLTPAKQALMDLNKFIEEFPESDFLETAKEHAKRCKFILAKSELVLADYHFIREHYDSVLRRTGVVLESYQGSDLEPAALLLRARVYLKQNDKEKAIVDFETILKSFEGTVEAVLAKNFLAELR